MESFPLSIYVGPVTLDRANKSFIANWWDVDKGYMRHPIDPKWVPWLEKHFRGGVLAGIGLAFVPAEMLMDNEFWRDRVVSISKSYADKLDEEHRKWTSPR